MRTSLVPSSACYTIHCRGCSCQPHFSARRSAMPDERSTLAWYSGEIGNYLSTTPQSQALRPHRTQHDRSSRCKMNSNVEQDSDNDDDAPPPYQSQTTAAENSRRHQQTEWQYDPSSEMWYDEGDSDTTPPTCRNVAIRLGVLIFGGLIIFVIIGFIMPLLNVWMNGCKNWDWWGTCFGS